MSWLLAEFRLMTNRSIRVALASNIRSRKRLVQTAYADLSRDHAVYKQYIPSAFEVALGVLKVHRRRLKLGKPTRAPFMRRLMLKAENQSYRLDRETGTLDLPIRAGEYVRIRLPVSRWHRSFLSDASWGAWVVNPRPRETRDYRSKDRASRLRTNFGHGTRHKRRVARWSRRPGK